MVLNKHCDSVTVTKVEYVVYGTCSWLEDITDADCPCH